MNIGRSAADVRHGDIFIERRIVEYLIKETPLDYLLFRLQVLHCFAQMGKRDRVVRSPKRKHSFGQSVKVWGAIEFNARVCHRQLPKG